MKIKAWLIVHGLFLLGLAAGSPSLLERWLANMVNVFATRHGLDVDG